MSLAKGNTVPFEWQFVEIMAWKTWKASRTRQDEARKMQGFAMMDIGVFWYFEPGSSYLTFLRQVRELFEAKHTCSF
jgi:hypothetical protein